VKSPTQKKVTKIPGVANKVKRTEQEVVTLKKNQGNLTKKIWGKILKKIKKIKSKKLNQKN
jgi:hypothetical protein